MKEIKVQGLVIKVKIHKEKDAWLSIYTKEYGLLTGYIKGVKSSKSKNHAGGQLLTISECLIHVNEETGFKSILKVFPIMSYSHALNDLKRYTYACFICDLIFNTVNENEPNDHINTLVFQTLEDLKDNNQITYAMINMMFALCQYQGISPTINECVICGSKKQIVGFSITSGGYICYQCQYDATLEPLSPQIIAYLHKLSRTNLPDEKTQFLILMLLVKYYVYHTGYKLKTVKALHSL